MKREAPTTKARMAEQRDYWRQRARLAERQLEQAAKCVRALLRARGAAEKWLRLFDEASG